jgi:NAD(P)-dependent dehydrogenase (short-subunit alcohol dehydrogenase family)
LQRTLPPEELTLKEWDIVARIDLRGTYVSCAAFGVPMAARGRGAIVNIASVAGMRSGPLHAYGPAKAGVISIGESLAAEWGLKGVRVNTVSPGYTLTPALKKGMALGTLDEGLMIGSSAIGRLVRADEIAAAVAFLAGDQASAITGVNLPVDGGYLVATPWAGYGGLRRPA